MIKNIQSGEAYWHYDPDAGAWYIGLEERKSPPYKKQIRVEAILDLDKDGRLAGIEILEAIKPSKRRDK